MKIEGFDFVEQELTFAETEKVMESLGFARDGHWDYNHATYDYKYEYLDDIYYLRIHAEAIKGTLENPEAVLKLGEPFIGKATFPHGVDYEAEIPNQIMDNSKDKLDRLVKSLAS